MKKLLVIVAFLFSTAIWANENVTFFYVDGLSCPFCAASIEKEFKKKPPVESVDITLKTGKVVLTLKKDQSITQDEIEKAVKDAGFSVRQEKKKKDNGEKKKE